MDNHSETSKSTQLKLFPVDLGLLLTLLSLYKVNMLVSQLAYYFIQSRNEGPTFQAFLHSNYPSISLVLIIAHNK